MSDPASPRPGWGFTVVVAALTVTIAAFVAGIAFDARFAHGGLIWATLLTVASAVLSVSAVLMCRRRNRDADDHRALATGRDALTGLANRVTFYAEVDRTLAAADGALGALVLIDLDRFREINDALGHETGDRLLQDVASRIGEALRADDTIARLGGDEFAIFLPGVPDEAAATRITAKIAEALETPFRAGSLMINVSASMGVAVAPAHGDDVRVLMQHADVAMYAAKLSRAGVEVYDERHDIHSPDRLSLHADLHNAVDNGEFELYYQPKALLLDGRVEGVEALCRWQHPTRGMIPPSDFIPMAEASGLIKPITLWVVDQALAQAKRWREEGIALAISVNLSAQSLHDVAITHDIATLLAKWDADAEWLRLEITESAVMQDPVGAMTRLNGLADMGLELSMDDYGTGYSSLTYLKRMPLTELKIDRSFVANITADQKDALIVGSTVELGHSLGLRVVAEGVECEDDWIGLQMLGCDVAQGFFLGHPMPAEGIVAWLEETGRRYVRVNQE